MSIPFISVFQTNICIHKPFPLRIINPAPQIIQSRLLIVHIPTITERIQRTNRRCQTAGFTDRITPRIITIFYHLRTIRVNRRNHIALQVVDFYHSAYKRLYMPFRGIKWSSLFGQKKEKTFDFSKVFILVEVTGFEPATFWSRTKRATKLRYTSKMEPMKGLEPLTCGLRNRCSTD